MSAKIGGAANLLVATSHTLVEQAVSIAAVTPGQNLRAGGSFGGRENGEARLLVVFLDESLGRSRRCRIGTLRSRSPARR
ncbi:MAG: hypothetical protein ACF8XB_11220 [Planctomycetota bacterium JB042]